MSKITFPVIIAVPHSGYVSEVIDNERQLSDAIIDLVNEGNIFDDVVFFQPSNCKFILRVEVEQ